VPGTFSRLALVLFLVVSVVGCASIVGKDLFPLTINSNPDGAKIVVKDEHGRAVFSGQTPTTVSLNAGESYFHAKEYTITFSKEGFADQQAVVKATISGWYFGNILFGGLIGFLIVDPITGKMWKLPDTPVVGNLYAKTAESGNSQSLQIVTIDQIPADVRSTLVALK